MKPFLKWAGGKYKLVPKIQSVLPEGKRLVEPFVGSGAVFMNTQFDNYLLTDSNADLINLFQHLQSEKASFVDYVETLFTLNNSTEEAYYKFRNDFNNTDDIRYKSAIFVYLNKHCYNGLCRYNASGGFNVPFGKRVEPSFPKKEMLAFIDKSEKAKFRHADFMHTMENAKKGDVVYCDPPYVPLSMTANFTSYSKGIFGIEEHKKLTEMAKKLQKRGIPVIISNHNTDFTQQAYQDAEILEFDVQRNISCDGANRIKAKELLAIFAS